MMIEDIIFQFGQLLSQGHFLRPYWLLLLLPALLLLYGIYRSQQVDELGVDIADHLKQVLTVSTSSRRRFSPIIASALAMIVAITALAGPAWRTQSAGEERHIDKVIWLSLSESMNGDDIKPSRLIRAQHKIHDLLQQHDSSRTTLIVYAGSAHSVIPLTSDNDIILNFSGVLTTDIMPVDGNTPETALPILTHIVSGLSQGGDKEEARHLSPTVPAVIWISDGLASGAANNVSAEALKKYFSQQAIPLFIWDFSQEVEARSSFSTVSLKQLAQQMHSEYQSVSVSDKDVSAVKKWLLIQQSQWRQDNDNAPWRDDGYYLLFPLAALLLLWFRRGWSLNWMAGLLCVLLVATPIAPPVMAASDQNIPTDVDIAVDKSFASWSARWLRLWLTDDQLGQWYFNRGEYLSAANAYKDTFSKAQAYYYAQVFDRAALEFSKLDSAKAQFNYANALAQQRNYIAAEKVYLALLKAYPDHAAAKYNQQLLRRIIIENQQLAESQQQEHEDSSQALQSGDEGSGGAEDRIGEREYGSSVEQQDGSDDAVEEQANKVAGNQFSAEQILADQAIQDLWMSQVQQDPAEFLAAKFQIQWQRRQTRMSETPSAAESP